MTPVSAVVAGSKCSADALLVPFASFARGTRCPGTDTPTPVMQSGIVSGSVYHLGSQGHIAYSKGQRK